MKNRKWTLLFFELLVAVSLTVCYYLTVHNYSMTSDNPNTFLAASKLANFDIEQNVRDGNSWTGRLFGMFASGFLADSLVKTTSNNPISMDRFADSLPLNTGEMMKLLVAQVPLDKFADVFALYHSFWLLLLFIAIICALREPLMVNLGIFAGAMYYFTPEAGFRSYPWDVPATLFFTLSVLLYMRGYYPLMLASVFVGFLFKETVLVCAILLLFNDSWNWKKRIGFFLGTICACLVAKRLMLLGLHLDTQTLAMGHPSTGSLWKNVAEDATEWPVKNWHEIFSLRLNHVIFVNCGTLAAVLVLGWSNRRMLPYMVIILFFLAGLFFYGAINEYRIFMEVLPLSWIVLIDYWKGLSEPIGDLPNANEAVGRGKVPRSGAVGRLLGAPADGGWEFLRTGKALKVMSLSLIVSLGCFMAWRYLIVEDNRDPNHQTRILAELEIAALGGNADAEYQMALHYLAGEGVPTDATSAVLYFSKAAAQGHAQAECNLGLLYFQGNGVEKDVDTANALFEKAAAQGNIDAQYNLGLAYENGLGVKQDIAEATDWYQRAADKGSVAATNRLGMIWLQQRKDYAEAEHYFRKAAEQGDASAENNLGVMYSQGLGVKQDVNEALNWFQQSANQGLADGQFDCGQLYVEARRYNDAAPWLEKAASQGHAGAQFALGQLSQAGLGRPEDIAEATLWYLRAARKGNGQAQLALGNIYRQGLGLKADNVEAYKWLKLAQLQGVGDAAKELADCKAKMSNDQISVAEDGVKQFQEETQMQ